MSRSYPVFRLSAVLACLAVSTVLACLTRDYLPDRDRAVLQGRKELGGSAALACSFVAQRGDLPTIAALLDGLVRDNNNLLSMGYRAPDGKLLAEAGEHAANWSDLPSGQSNATEMQAPVIVDGAVVATLELHFQPVAPAGALGFLRPDVLRLLGFVAVATFLGTFLFLKGLIALRPPAGAKVVPKRVRAALNALSEGVVILDKEQRIAMANAAFARNLNQPVERLEGRKLSEFPWLLVRADAPWTEFPWVRVLGEAVPQASGVLQLSTETARPLLLSANASPVLGEDGTCRGALVTFDDVTALEKKNAQMRRLLRKLRHSRDEARRRNLELRDLAIRDPLTGCLNRRAFFVEFEGLWSGALRYGHSLSCLMVDIDHFKVINDTHGHAVGDRILQHVGELLRSLARKSDRVCRYGGEEFCILLPHVDLEEATAVAERYCREIGSRSFAGIAVTASLGISAMGLEAREPAELLEQADKALYAAKKAGRNRLVRWDRMPPDIPRQEVEDRPSAAPWSNVPIPFPAVAVLFTALSHRHPETAAHSRRVADLCVATAAGLLPQTRCYILEVAALLHDIGKVGVSDGVLRKPGPLHDDEWQEIRTHEHLGNEIITTAFNSDELSLIVRNRYAWYGGNPRHPDLPVGTAIPVTARILAIADAFDSMTSDHAYRKGWDRDEAFAELRRCAGTQFDPALVERFIEVMSAGDGRNRKMSGTYPKARPLSGNVADPVGPSQRMCGV
jgi:diguanylate cyclase (GGDEF)-like protein